MVSCECGAGGAAASRCRRRCAHCERWRDEGRRVRRHRGASVWFGAGRDARRGASARSAPSAISSAVNSAKSFATIAPRSLHVRVTPIPSPAPASSAAESSAVAPDPTRAAPSFASGDGGPAGGSPESGPSPACCLVCSSAGRCVLSDALCVRQNASNAASKSARSSRWCTSSARQARCTSMREPMSTCWRPSVRSSSRPTCTSIPRLRSRRPNTARLSTKRDTRGSLTPALPWTAARARPIRRCPAHAASRGRLSF